MAQHLSDDILYNTFLHALPTAITTSGHKFHYQFRAELECLPPFNFSLVCRSWRSVCMSSPRLWSSIDASFLSELHHPRINSLLEYWFLRGASAPLDCSIHFYYRSLLDDPERNALDLVARQWHRWNETLIYVKAEAWIDANCPLMFRCSPSAKSLKIESLDRVLREFGPIMGPGHLDLTSCTTNVASKLQVLEVASNIRWDIPKSDRCAGSALNLPNLRHLRFNTDCNLGFDTLLAACPELSTLRIYMGRNASQSRMEGVSLPHLTSLNIYTESDVASNCLLGNLSCTSLGEFFYYNVEKATSLSLRLVTAFLSKQTGLQVLYLYYAANVWKQDAVAYPPDSHSEHVMTLKKILKPLENLQTLNLGGIIINDEIIELLTPQQGGALLLCPSLTDLDMTTLRPRTSLAVMYKVLEEMVVSRWKGRKGKFAIHLNLEGFEKFAEASQRIQECFAEGLGGRLF